MPTTGMILFELADDADESTLSSCDVSPEGTFELLSLDELAELIRSTREEASVSDLSRRRMRSGFMAEAEEELSLFIEELADSLAAEMSPALTDG